MAQVHHRGSPSWPKDATVFQLPRSVVARATFGQLLSTSDLLRLWTISQPKDVALSRIAAKPVVSSEEFSVALRNQVDVSCVLTRGSIVAVTRGVYGQSAGVIALENEAEVLVIAVIKRGGRVELTSHTSRSMSQVLTCDDAFRLAQTSWS